MITRPEANQWDNIALLNEAICYATLKHAGQYRKGSATPYILHPLEALNILHSMNADIELMIAGVLHDTIEDTSATKEEIMEKFGDGVAALVCANSEDKSKSWAERKKHTIDSLARADRRVKMLVMADKLSNLRSMDRDYRACGDKLWERFNAPVDKQSWYYSGILDALADFQNDSDAGAVYWELMTLYKEVFVRYFLDAGSPWEKPYLLQVTAHHEVYRMVMGNPRWNFELSADTHGLTLLSRKEAEVLEDEWNRPFWSQINSDLTDVCHTLVSTPRRGLEFIISNKQISFQGQDLGGASQIVSDDSEYEYFLSFDEDNTMRLLVQLRLDYGIDPSLKEIIKKEFSAGRGLSKLMTYCKSKNIDYKFHSR